MSFAHAPVSKGILLITAATSLAVGVFDVKHHVHLQLVPHITKHHQFARLLTHSIPFSDSTHLFVAHVLLFNLGVHVERRFGSRKFASFALVSTLLGSVLELLVLALRGGQVRLPSGPFVLVFAILYQHYRIVPSTYRFCIFGISFTNKSFHYLLSLYLFSGNMTSSMVGLLTGALYRSDLLNLKSYRIPDSIVDFSSRLLLPLVGSLRPPRRPTRVYPTSSSSDSHTFPSFPFRPVTTTTTTDTTQMQAEATTTPAAGQDGVVREWVDNLTGRTQRSFRVPPEREIAQLTSMFPDLDRSVIVGALQRSPNVEAAVETLLSSSS